MKPVFDPISGTVIDSNALTTNVGSAEESGVGPEFTILPFDGTDISGSYGYLTTEIQSDVFLLVNPAPNEIIENFNGN